MPNAAHLRSSYGDGRPKSCKVTYRSSRFLYKNKNEEELPLLTYLRGVKEK
jgi:hypothetical protein